MLYRRYSPLSMWEEMERLQRRIDSLMGQRYRPAPTFPAMNIWTNDEGAVVSAEIPGINIDELDISVVGQTLTLSGSRPLDDTGENARYHRQERGYGNFTRSIELPFQVEADKVEAAYKNGVLKISLPRSATDKPKKIAVKTA